MYPSRFKASNSGMPGMRPFPREKTVEIGVMNADELRTLYRRNEEVLRTLTASSSTFVSRIEANQAKIRERLAQLEGMDAIQRGMRHTTIGEESPMSVDSEPETQVSSTVKVKKEAIAAWDKKATKQNPRSKVATLSLEEAIALEQQQNAIEQARRERVEARRAKQSMPKASKTPSREEYEAKVWAFMSYKPTESDLEGEDDDDDDDDDPASWFHDEEDDGVKGQDIVYPDAEDLADIIRVDESSMHYSTFYEPRDEDF